MNNLAAVFIIVLLSFVCSLSIFRYILPTTEMMMIMPLILIGVNIVLHFIYAARRRVSLAALPAAWASCIGPLYIYCYSIEHYRLNEKRFAFLVLLFVMWAPVLAASLITSAIGYCVRRYGVSKSGGPSNNG